MTLAVGMHRFTQMERVIHGRAIEEALREEVALLGAGRALLVTNRSVAAGALLERVRSTLGSRLAGTYAGVTAHAPRACAIDAAREARAAGADLLVAVGGGSVIDAAKAVALVLRRELASPRDLEPYANVRAPDVGRTPPDAAQWLRVVAVPTTFSGAEFASSAGLTDPARAMKHAFVHPMMMPVSVVLDPSMTLATPPRLLLASGVKAIDHAAERMTSAAANPYSDAVSTLALRLLGAALPRIVADPRDLGARADAQYGMFMSLAGSASGVAVNVSHAIGHVLGAHAGVPHGETSCVMLPATLRWNADAAAEPQCRIAQALGAPDEAPAQTIERLVSALGLPGRLRDVGVRREDFDEIAAKTMHEVLLRNSRKPVDSPREVVRILESAW